MNRNIRRWMRASRQSTAVLGVAMIALIWGSIGYQLSLDHRNAMDGAYQDSSNLARAFEEFVSRTINGEVSTLAMLRTIYTNNPKSVTMLDWPKIIGPVSDVIVQYSVIDKAGIMVTSSSGSTQRIDLSDREHFKAHLDGDDDKVFVGKPLVGRASNRPSIQLSKRVSAPDGSFNGVVVSSLDPNKLASFYDSIDIGKDGAISLTGTDKVIRASKGFKTALPDLQRPGGLLSRVQTEDRGTYVTSGAADGVVRVLSYRKVAGLPLVVAVGVSVDEVLAPYYKNQTKYFAIGAGITLLVLIVIVVSATSRFKLNRVYEYLRKSEAATRENQTLLRTTLENIEQGIMMADPAGHIKVINRRAIELLDLPEEWLIAANLNLSDTLAYLWDRGEFQNDNSDYGMTSTLTGQGQYNGVAIYERMRPNGIVLEIRTLGLPDGSLVRTFRDITSRKQAEAKIAKLAHHDDLTGLANRMLFKERIKQAFSRSQRSGESFAVLCLDLDRFKTINDTMGHPAGDHVLIETARRLKLCVRDIDVVARLGGDEFAILQTGSKTDEEAASLAERTLKAIRGVYDVEGEEVFIGASIGIAFAPRHGASYDQIMTRADKALYQAKKNGANCYAFCHNGISFAPEAA